MIKFIFEPKDKDIYTSTELTFNCNDDCGLEEHVNQFKSFLNALTFDSQLTDLIVIDYDEILKNLENGDLKIVETESD